MECKNDRIDNKLQWELFPIESPAFEWIVRVFEVGKSKYYEGSWKVIKDAYKRLKGASFRHLIEHERGNIIDQETGMPHLAQFAWNANIMLHHWLEEYGEINVREIKCPHCNLTNFVEKEKKGIVKCYKCKTKIEL